MDVTDQCQLLPNLSVMLRPAGLETASQMFCPVRPANNPSTALACIRLLTHWGTVAHIFVNKLTISGSDNGLSPGRRKAIIWTNAGILLIGPLGTNFSEILIEIRTFLFPKNYLEMSSGQWWSFCLSLNVLKAAECQKGAQRPLESQIYHLKCRQLLPLCPLGARLWIYIAGLCAKLSGCIGIFFVVLSPQQKLLLQDGNPNADLMHWT